MLNRADLYKDGCLIIKNIDTVQFHKRVLWLKPRECFDIIQGFFFKGMCWVRQHGFILVFKSLI